MSGPGIGQYLEYTVKSFEAEADTVYAMKMKKYMRNQFEFLGLSSTKRKEVQRQVIKEAGLPVFGNLEEIVFELWNLPEREYQYFAMELLSRKIKKAPPEIIKLIEELILTKSWWDTIDFLSPALCGTLFKKHPELIRPTTRRWMDSGNIWLQRSCILFQLKYGKSTDPDLLYSFIRQLSNEKEFFIRKAIGWSLRQYSKFNPAEVKRFVTTHELQPLSVKEAMKYVK